MGTKGTWSRVKDHEKFNYRHAVIYDKCKVCMACEHCNHSNPNTKACRDFVMPEEKA